MIRARVSRSRYLVHGKPYLKMVVNLPRGFPVVSEVIILTPDEYDALVRKLIKCLEVRSERKRVEERKERVEEMEEEDKLKPQILLSRIRKYKGLGKRF